MKAMNDNSIREKVALICAWIALILVGCVGLVLVTIAINGLMTTHTTYPRHSSWHGDVSLRLKSVG